MTFGRDSHQNFELKRTGIYKAIEEGDLERVRNFIAEGIDFPFPADEKKTNLKMILLLISWYEL